MALTSGLSIKTLMCRQYLLNLCGGCRQLSQKPFSKHLSSMNSQQRISQIHGTLAREYSTPGTCSVHKLSSKGVFIVEGKDADDFLQGIITNTVKHLETPRSAIYSMMLNIQGRVMYDLLVYNISDQSDQPCYLIECDGAGTESLIKDIRKYKLRKKVNIANVTENYCLTAVLPSHSGSVQELSVPDTDCVIFTPDPRVKQFGWRLITAADHTNKDVTSQLGTDGSEEDYHILRYQWGISEGCIDLPPANCFPLESNLVYLNGACFQKGCYIGQELTARTYHTGVTRKRLMPIEFETIPEKLSPGADIRTEDDRPAGKYRSSIGRYGLGLMRLAEINKKLVIKNDSDQRFHVTASQPSWWPDDANAKK